MRNPTAIPGKDALRLVLRSSKSGRRKSRDCGDAEVAKNVITVGAVNDAVSGGQRDPAAASMSSFSGWGPVDDGRVKPDLVANGVGLYSTDSGNDNDYRTMSGTSMASPNAAGTAALLVDLYRDRSGGSFPLAASLKALLIHSRQRPRPADHRSGRLGICAFCSESLETEPARRYRGQPRR